MCDSEKLIHLVGQRPAIFNTKIKEHSDKKKVEVLWREIAKEMQCEVGECKHKWATLRNSYARYIRAECINIQSGTRKRKTWYLADAMCFLKEHMNPRRCSSGRPSPSTEQHDDDDDNGDDFNSNTSNDILKPEAFMIQEHLSQDSTTINNCNFKFKNEQQQQQQFTAAANASRIDENLNEYLHSRSIRRSSDEEQLTQLAPLPPGPPDVTDEIMDFLKSLAPDMKRLHEQKLRIFKRHTFAYLHSLLDTQENESLEMQLGIPTTGFGHKNGTI